jgi:hypothetical protein
MFELFVDSNASSQFFPWRKERALCMRLRICLVCRSDDDLGCLHCHVKANYLYRQGRTVGKLTFYLSSSNSIKKLASNLIKVPLKPVVPPCRTQHATTRIFQLTQCLYRRDYRRFIGGPRIFLSPGRIFAISSPSRASRLGDRSCNDAYG